MIEVDAQSESCPHEKKERAVNARLIFNVF